MALLLLAALIISVLQVIFMILGWYRIKNSAPEQHEDDDDTAGSRNGLVAGITIGAAVLLTALVLWPKSAPAEAEEYGTDDCDTEYVIDEDWDEPTGIEEAEAETYFEEEAAPESTDDGADQYTYAMQGFINGSYAIEMTLYTDGGNYFSGEYFYTKNKTPIELRGQLTDGSEHLVLDEYVGMNNTGTFDGTFSGSSYTGTWTRADGEKSFPFSVTVK